MTNRIQIPSYYPMTGKSPRNAPSRRSFLRSIATCMVGASLGQSQNLFASIEKKRPFPIHGFSKHFQELTADALAEFALKSRWDGVDLTVRKGGHIAPDSVEKTLPAFVKTLRNAGLQVDMITTDIRDTTSPQNKSVLQTAAELGIRYYRLAYWSYDAKIPVLKQLDQTKREVEAIAKTNREFKLTAGVQNHSGEKYIGASIWDAWYLLKDIDPSEVSMFFDIGHAVIEGGLSWPNDLRLVQSHVSAVYAKDFEWKQTNGSSRPVWCPYGKGIVPNRFYQMLKESGWSGPVSLHHEYDLPKNIAERLTVVLEDTIAFDKAAS